MWMTDRRRAGGVAAVVAAFWLGFVCGGGSLPGAAVIGGASGQPPQEPAPASQPPQEPAPASQPPQDPAPASQPPQDPAPVSQPPQDPAPASQPPQEPAPAPEESGPAPQPPGGPAPAQDQPPAQADSVPAEESTQADAVPEESTQADVAPEESTEPDAETEGAPVPEPPLVQERPREFTARTGMVLYFVNAGGETAYEETMARVADALAASESEERRQQGEGWSTYKAEESLADGGRLYVSWLDPVVPGADYWVPGILNEAFPTEAQTLYETYAGAFADGQILLNLVPIPGP